MPTNETIQRELERVKMERDDAVADVERLLWLSGICKYCAKCKSKTGQHRNLDNPCQSCEPVWRGPKKRRFEQWND